MKILNAYSRFLDVLEKIIKVILVIFLSAMVLIMIYQAVMRYVFSNAPSWAEELTLYIGIFSIMLGLGVASRHDSHLQVDFLTRLYKPRVRCFMAALWSFVTIVLMVIFASYSISLMINHATARSVTLPITMKQIYAAFPIGSAILILYSIEIMARNLVGFAHGGELPTLPGRKGGDEV